MKGGSVASDAVTTLVNNDTYDQMSARFTNKFGGGCGCGKDVGGRKACAIHKRGGSLIKQILGNSTVNALKGGNGTCGSSTAKVGGRQRGGNHPSVGELIASNASLDFSVKNRQSGGNKQKKKKQQSMKGGYADAPKGDIAPKPDLMAYKFTPRTPPSASPTEVLATEGVQSLPLIQKTAYFGQITGNTMSPFSYGAPRAMTPMQPIMGSVVAGANLPSQAGGTKKKRVVKKAAAKKVAPAKKAVAPAKKRLVPKKRTVTKK